MAASQAFRCVCVLSCCFLKEGKQRAYQTQAEVPALLARGRQAQRVRYERGPRLVTV